MQGTTAPAETEAVRGTSGWHPLEVEFETGPGARLLELQIARRTSWRFDSKIKGSVWIDDVSIERK